MSDTHGLRPRAGEIEGGPQELQTATLKAPTPARRAFARRRRRGLLARPAPRKPGSLGRLPVLAASTAVGLAICSVTDALSRATLAPSVWLFWAGIAVIVGPIVFRLCAAEVSVGERVLLVCMLGLGLYVVKVMRDPFGYTIPDEFFHAYNAQQIALHHVLFTRNTLLPVSARYPGLEGATSALMALTGMSSFGAGLIVIGAARLTLMLAMLVLFFWVSGSWRVASLATVAYAGNTNFLLWSAQFSYESLSLPLLIFVLACIAQRSGAVEAERRAWSVPIVLGIAAIVITHHLTSYLLAVLLVLLALAPLVTRGRVAATNVWKFAALSIAMTVGWLIVVASQTVGYISPLATRAFSQTLHTILGESAPRTPFGAGANTPGAPSTPLPERAVAYLALALLLIVLPFGVRAAWRRHKHDPFAVGFCLAALGFFAVLGLRLAPSAWEIANRLDEFLFVGLAFIVAYALVDRLLSGRHRPIAPVVAAILVGVVVVGNAISGWPPDNVVAAPVTVLANGHQIDSETLAVGRWFGAHLPGAGTAAQQSDSRTILLYGNGHVITSPAADIEDILPATSITSVQLALLKANGARYVVVDRRVRSADASRGFRFSVRPPGGPLDILLPPGVNERFDDIPLARMYDSGNVTVYDMQSRR